MSSARPAEETGACNDNPEAGGAAAKTCLVDAAIAAADVDVGVLVLMVADEQVVVHQLEVLQAGCVL